MLELNQSNGMVYDVTNGETVAIMIDNADPTMAALFAASPDLLNACKAALVTLEDEYPERVRGDYNVFTTLREAIAKAEAK